ncbi:hypothetical protein XO10_02155 [Marinitoga sp. 1135]|uniref:hypothetical protein n=1 Tax=Marinitoga sp. 1135 TaxID=1643333 RepID=UPI0015869D77|nr:hypothetical protein [Marinitoga sp. 1135]NUU95099.1 hypothetical protein [Marinitoga sp. 1135]
MSILAIIFGGILFIIFFAPLVEFFGKILLLLLFIGFAVFIIGGTFYEYYEKLIDFLSWIDWQNVFGITIFIIIVIILSALYDFSKSFWE